MPEVADAFDHLMRKVRLGDGAALAQLLQRYEREVQQAARCLLGRALRSSLDPADLVQSVHRTLIRGFQEHTLDVPSPEKLVALAVTVARNKARRAARKLRCQQRHSAALAETAALGETRTAAGPPPDPARQAEYNDIVERISCQLGPADRRLVELRLQGFSTAEVARALGLNADVLRVRLSRLRRDLRAKGLLTGWI
jgi:RNA polymerase sigma-70 factor (ECF subfamily)